MPQHVSNSVLVLDPKMKIFFLIRATWGLFFFSSVLKQIVGVDHFVEGWRIFGWLPTMRQRRDRHADEVCDL